MGTRCDLTAARAVDYDAARAFAQKHSMLYVETSAREDINVTDAFVLLVLLSVLKLQHAPADWVELQPLVPSFSAAVMHMMQPKSPRPSIQALVEETRGESSRPPSPQRCATPPRAPSGSTLAAVSTPPLPCRRGSRIINFFSKDKKEKPLVRPEPIDVTCTVPPFMRKYEVFVFRLHVIILMFFFF